MTALPPSPFLTDSVAQYPHAAGTAAALSVETEAAAETFESSTATGGTQEAPAAADPNTVAAGLLREIEQDYRFRLDVRAFMEAIEPPPVFLQFTKIS